MSLVELFFRSIFIDNLALSFALGLYTVHKMGNRIRTALIMGLSIFILLIFSVITNNLILNHFLAKGTLYWATLEELDLTFISYLLYFALLALYLKVFSVILKKYSIATFDKLAPYLKELLLSSTVLGASLIMTERVYSLPQACVWSLGAGLGWFLVIAIFAGLKDRLKYSDIPRALQAGGVVFALLGLIGMVFMGYGALLF